MGMELDGLRQEIFLSRYAMVGETKWDECAKRVAGAISSVERADVIEEWKGKFFDVINAGDLIAGGRILFGAGRRQFNMLNCFRLHPDDTVSSIAKMIHDTYLISCGGGGIGINFSDIRPQGDDIQTIQWSAPGSVSNMKMINEVAEHVRAGKNRRTALLAILNVDHPDLFEFLRVKLDLNQLNNFNISVGITNEFLDAVGEDRDWHFKFRGRDYHVFELEHTRKVDGKTITDTVRVTALNEEDAVGRANVHHKVNHNDTFKNLAKINTKAREIWELIIGNSWRCGDPGIYNLSMANEYTNVSYFESLDSCNPCGEVGLPKFGNCCLGNVNLANMYDKKSHCVNWKRLAKTVRVGIRFLDNVLSCNYYPIMDCKTVGGLSRRIGLGVTGLHYLLIKLGYKYGDESCLEFLTRLFATIRNEAYKASIKLAREKGSFPSFDTEKYLQEQFCTTLPPWIQADIRKYGIRNAVMLTVPPCGTTSIVLGVSSGVEPIFAPVYERSYRVGKVWKTETVVDRLFAEYYNNDKSLENFCGAHEITPTEHMAVQATIQKYVDSSISKTINLPENYPIDGLSDLVLEYAKYIKGCTIYRTNSRGMEPLKPVDVSDIEVLKGIMDSHKVIDSVSKEACKNGTCEL